MKKILSIFLTVLILATTAFAAVACGNKPNIKDYFTVVSFNTRVWDMEDMSGIAHDERVNLMKTQIASVNPDLIGLQEIDNFSTRSGSRDYSKELAPDSFNTYFAKAYSISDYIIYGISTITKTPAVVAESFDLPNPVKEDLIEKASFSEKLSLSISIENRIVQRTVVNVLGTQIAFYNTHTSFESAEMRVAQIQYIYDLIQSDPIPYRVCVGDFNSGNGVLELEPFFNDYFLCINKDNPKVTFPPKKTLDNIIVSKNLKVLNFTVHETSYSDHYMISADIRIDG